VPTADTYTPDPGSPAEGCCRHCGRKLAMLQRLAKHQFCSAAHRALFLELQQELALSRLREQSAPAHARAPAPNPAGPLVQAQPSPFAPRSAYLRVPADCVPLPAHRIPARPAAAATVKVVLEPAVPVPCSLLSISGSLCSHLPEPVSTHPSLRRPASAACLPPPRVPRVCTAVEFRTTRQPLLIPLSCPFAPAAPSGLPPALETTGT